ncbi:MAG: II family cellulose-binding protein [Sphingobacteriia bacterium 28-36-52]|nr:MAG: II family cellulose-binding protein [Sphingobacteriia bacterium 32-37-4]OYZ02229.1 MAG: II family cellulose-binding protein [Sphingobacteriia bacterium 28-36-52]
MDISINTPALLFPAISLIMLAYTNRFLALATRVRSLHNEYNKTDNNPVVHGQIKNLRFRIKLIKQMQALGVMAFLSCIICMYFIYIEWMVMSHWVFAFSLLSFSCSLALSLWEIQLSTKALELELSDMEGLEDPTVIEYIKSKFDKDKD